MHTYLEKRDPLRNQARFYQMAVRPNLFGEWTLERQWGRIGQGGRTRMDWYIYKTDAEAAFLALETAKRRRGYDEELQQLPSLALRAKSSQFS